MEIQLQELIEQIKKDGVEGAEPVVVYIPGDSEVEGTATLSGNKITVSFGELTEEGVYTYSIPEGFFTMDGVENEYTSVSVELYTFEIVPLEVVSVTPVEGNVAELSKIIIEFNQNIALSYENWQQISQQIVLKGEDKDYTLTYNSASNIGNTLEYITNAQWDGYKYVSTPITAAGKYTLDLSQIVVDHAGESYIDEWGYPNTTWHSKNQVCNGGTKTWTIVAGESSIDDVVVENGAKVIYDLTGRRIENITDAGIYIVNGKKVLVK